MVRWIADVPSALLSSPLPSRADGTSAIQRDPAFRLCTHLISTLIVRVVSLPRMSITFTCTRYSPGES